MSPSLFEVAQSADALNGTPFDRVRAVDPLDEPEWDGKIAHSRHATFFHSAAWAQVLRDTYGFKPIYLVAEADGSCRAILPLIEIDSWITGRRGVSLPFTDECVPLVSDKQALTGLIDAAKSCANLRQWRYVELRSVAMLIDGATTCTRYFGHTLELHQTLPQLFTNCESAVRRAVRKAAGTDLQIEFSQSLAAVKAFHGLLCQTRRRHGVPPQPQAFFEQFHRHVLAKSRGIIVLARLAGRAVAGAVFVHFGRHAIYKYGASDDSYQGLRPNNLVMWRGIEWHARAGFKLLDFGRTALDNHGLRRFKLGWGSRERVIEYVRYNQRGQSFSGLKREAPAWQQRIFRNLPVPVLRTIGAVAYRHVG